MFCPDAIILCLLQSHYVCYKVILFVANIKHWAQWICCKSLSVDIIWNLSVSSSAFVQQTTNWLQMFSFMPRLYICVMSTHIHRGIHYKYTSDKRDRNAKRLTLKILYLCKTLFLTSLNDLRLPKIQNEKKIIIIIKYDNKLANIFWKFIMYTLDHKMCFESQTCKMPQAYISSILVF